MRKNIAIDLGTANTLVWVAGLPALTIRLFSIFHTRLMGRVWAGSAIVI